MSADVLIPNLKGDKDTPADQQGGALHLIIWLHGSIFNNKCKDYLQACEREGLSFIPPPVKSVGGWF